MHPPASLTRRSLLMTAACAATTPLLAQPAAYPTKPIRLIVPTAAGGSYDLVGRLVGERLSTELSQSVVIENRTGTNVGTQVAFAAPADGYTLVVGGTASMAFAAGMFDNLGFKPADFVPVALVGAISYTLVARKDLPVTNLRQLIDYARANPGKLSIGTAGSGSGQHVAAALLESLANIALLIVPYKGAQPVYTDLLGGRVDLFFDSTAGARGFVQDGRVRALATSKSTREMLLPDVPTGQEAGLPGLVLETWLGFFAPPRTPAPVIETLRNGIQKAMQQPQLRERLQATGIQPLTMEPAETEKYLKVELEKWPAFVRKAGIKPD